MRKPNLYIDGELTEYTDFYPIKDCLGKTKMGMVAGVNEVTQAKDKVRNYEVTKTLHFVNVFKRNEDGSIWGIRAAFREGQWTEDEEGGMVISVSDRIV